MHHGAGFYEILTIGTTSNPIFRGAEIPPPPSLNSGAPKNNKVVGAPSAGKWKTTFYPHFCNICKYPLCCNSKKLALQISVPILIEIEVIVINFN